MVVYQLTCINPRIAIPGIANRSKSSGITASQVESVRQAELEPSGVEIVFELVWSSDISISQARSDRRYRLLGAAVEIPGSRRAPLTSSGHTGCGSIHHWRDMRDRKSHRWCTGWMKVLGSPRLGASAIRSGYDRLTCWQESALLTYCWREFQFKPVLPTVSMASICG